MAHEESTVRRDSFTLVPIQELSGRSTDQDMQQTKKVAKENTKGNENVSKRELNQTMMKLSSKSERGRHDDDLDTAAMLLVGVGAFAG